MNNLNNNFSKEAVFPTNDFVFRWKILETEYSKKVLTDDFEIDILELPKVKKYDKENNKNKSLLLWTKFFTNPEELEEKEMEENVDIQIIISVTGLSGEDIKNLK